MSAAQHRLHTSSYDLAGGRAVAVACDGRGQLLDASFASRIPPDDDSPLIAFKIPGPAVDMAGAKTRAPVAD